MSKVVDFITARRASLPRFGLLRDLGLFCPSAKNDDLTQKLADTLARVQKLGGEDGVLRVTEGYRVPSKTWPGAWSLPREAYADVIAASKVYLDSLYVGVAVHLLAESMVEEITEERAAQMRKEVEDEQVG